MWLFIFLDLLSFRKVEVPNPKKETSGIILVTAFRPRCESCKKQLLENEKLIDYPRYAVGFGGSREELRAEVTRLGLSYPALEATREWLETMRITRSVTPVNFTVVRDGDRWEWKKNTGFIDKKAWQDQIHTYQRSLMIRNKSAAVSHGFDNR